MELWDVHFNTIGVRTKENMDESLKKKNFKSHIAYDKHLNSV